MASSKVMASTSTTNPDLPRHHLNQSPPPAPPSLTTQTHPLYHSSSTSLESVNMEEILKNMYTEPESLDAPSGSVSINGTATGVAVGPRMTLEDFLAKAGAVSEEDVVVVQVPPPPAPEPAVVGGDYGVDGHGMMGLQFPAAPGPVVHHMQQNGAAGLGTAEAAQLGYGGNGMVTATIGNGGRGGRGKRRGAPAEEMVLDKATQQKQKRMIKNRESAARSRERKQAYTVELETLVTQLEEENARLLRQEAEQNKKRLKQLMENLIPVEEKRRPPPPRSLRRVHSMSW